MDTTKESRDTAQKRRAQTGQRQDAPRRTAARIRAGLSAAWASFA